jgi:hypothetical protein
MSAIYWLQVNQMLENCSSKFKGPETRSKCSKRLAKKYSNCSSATKKGDLGEFVEGQMVQKFEDAVWVTEPETVPQNFIKTQFGYHILWVHEVILPE